MVDSGSVAPLGVVLDGGILGGLMVEMTGDFGGLTVETGMENSPNLTVAVSVTRGIRENNWFGDSVVEDKWMTLSSIEFSDSSF